MPIRVLAARAQGPCSRPDQAGQTRTTLRGAEQCPRPDNPNAATGKRPSQTEIRIRHNCPSQTPHLRILLAEDNPINQKVAMRILSRLGHVPVMVENGHEAVMAVQESDFDVVLMDIDTPELDGLANTLDPQGNCRRSASPTSLR